MKKSWLIIGIVCLLLAGLAFVLDIDLLTTTIGQVSVKIYTGFALLLIGLLALFYSLRQAV